MRIIRTHDIRPLDTTTAYERVFAVFGSDEKYQVHVLDSSMDQYTLLDSCCVNAALLLLRYCAREGGRPFNRPRAVVSCAGIAELSSPDSGNWSPAIKEGRTARPSTDAVVGWNGRLTAFPGSSV